MDKITKRHIKTINYGDCLKLNLNGVVSRAQFDTDSEPTNIVAVVCDRVDSLNSFEGKKVFRTADGKIHRPKEFQYDYKGYFYKLEDDITLWVYE